MQKKIKQNKEEEKIMALQRGIVELETYSEKWKEDYKKEEELLKKYQVIELQKFIILVVHLLKD